MVVFPCWATPVAHRKGTFKIPSLYIPQTAHGRSGDMDGGLEHVIDQFCKYYMTDLRIGNVGYSLV